MNENEKDIIDKTESLNLKNNNELKILNKKHLNLINENKD